VLQVDRGNSVSLDLPILMTRSAHAATALDALGDPTRRRVLELLRDRGEQPVGHLAEHLPVSRPAVSQHLRVLAGAGLVTARRDGTRRLYAVDDEGLRALRAYLETFWDVALASFQEAADRAADDRSRRRDR
jgi:DNA-binding transcriptional ArsR family regulator